MEITKEQINTLCSGIVSNEELLKEWFPEAFIELKVGKWYKIDRGYKNDVEALVFFQGQGVETFGFTHGGIWTDDYGSESSFCTPEYKYTKATHKEVETALINEAIRRGYENNNHDCLYLPNFTHKNTDELFYLNKDTMNLHIGKTSVSNVIFKEGEWAELIETITLKEAEKLLNKRIV